jgi:hypothetical protein
MPTPFKTFKIFVSKLMKDLAFDNSRACKFFRVPETSRLVQFNFSTVSCCTSNSGLSSSSFRRISALIAVAASIGTGGVTLSPIVFFLCYASQTCNDFNFFPLGAASNISFVLTVLAMIIL